MGCALAALALGELGFALAGGLSSAVISVQDRGEGNNYMSGEPITLPAGCLSTNLFGVGVQVIRDRAHVARPVVFDANGRLQDMPGEPTPPAAWSNRARLSTPLNTNGFPAYLVGQPYVWFLQNVRHYTNYACTVTVDRPATFYLLVDNRVNDYLPASAYDDPVFGPPDTEWILADGWQRVNTGLTPRLTPANAGDYVGVDEGNNGSINQAYAVYSRTLVQPGTVTLRTAFDGNIYCLVISTNVVAYTNQHAAPSSPKQTAGQSMMLPGRN